MVAFEQIFLTLVGLYLTPFFIIVGIVIIPACLGISFGVRKYYLRFLLKMFEFGRQKVEIACKDQGLQSNFTTSQPESSTRVSQAALIQKDSPKHLADVFKTGEGTTEEESFSEFELHHVCYLCKKGVEAIIDDDVTKCFAAEELGSWNLLTRTSMRYQYLNARLTVLWSLGFLFRYLILLPVRFVTFIVAIAYMIVSASFVGYLPQSRENRAKGGGICVANHTTPIDVIFISSDNCYAFIGQKHTGFVGFIERCMSRSGADHIWFDRSEMRDRQKVTNRLKAHAEDPNKYPMLIFPEGKLSFFKSGFKEKSPTEELVSNHICTCINNTSVMMFKKGSFEIGGVIYPVAMKYDPRFCDPFWNSSRDSFVRYLVKIMTSWDGQLKRMTVKSSYREKEQEEYSKLLKAD
ncbi:Glycerol-3-phosphate acyltransferase 4 [Holothuria leucospilota]|uniref:Glycerol-3-phosphate acyltransferase 4 n=1 Tax=Holothuria leucospilota TaxID=206669 RepID=A0A9Q0YP33_HOLLE|nr:Glycerol-3-phosphate acyltransferase 4 [Holothuria leucospilota]